VATNNGKTAVRRITVRTVRENPYKYCNLQWEIIHTLLSCDIKDLTPVRGQDGKISETQGKDSGLLSLQL
jgi:hypothetical protein